MISRIEFFIGSQSKIKPADLKGFIITNFGKKNRFIRDGEVGSAVRAGLDKGWAIIPAAGSKS